MDAAACWWRCPSGFWVCTELAVYKEMVSVAMAEEELTVVQHGCKSTKRWYEFAVRHFRVVVIPWISSCAGSAVRHFAFVSV